MSAETLHVPAKPRFIYISLSIAFFFNLLPWRNTGWMLQPDLVLLMLLYWHLYQPDKVSFGTAFALGLLLDVTDSSLLGQHALAYVIQLCLFGRLRRRLLIFEPRTQMAHLLAILFIGQTLMLLLRLSFGSSFPSLFYFVSSFTGTLVWPLLSWALREPLRRLAPNL